MEGLHFGAGMEKETLMEKLWKLGFDLPNEVTYFPGIPLGEVVVNWASKGGHDVSAYYIP